jgi:hypothetical protein
MQPISFPVPSRLVRTLDSAQPVSAVVMIGPRGTHRVRIDVQGDTGRIVLRYRLAGYAVVGLIRRAPAMRVLPSGLPCVG